MYMGNDELIYLKTSLKGDGQCFYFDKISTLGNQKKGALNPTNVFWGNNWHKIFIFQFLKSQICQLLEYSGVPKLILHCSMANVKTLLNVLYLMEILYPTIHSYLRKLA